MGLAHSSVTAVVGLALGCSCMVVGVEKGSMTKWTGPCSHEASVIWLWTSYGLMVACLMVASIGLSIWWLMA